MTFCGNKNFVLVNASQRGEEYSVRDNEVSVGFRNIDKP
jgi:hypothetical protein